MTKYDSNLERLTASGRDGLREHLISEVADSFARADGIDEADAKEDATTIINCAIELGKVLASVPPSDNMDKLHGFIEVRNPVCGISKELRAALDRIEWDGLPATVDYDLSDFGERTAFMLAAATIACSMPRLRVRVWTERIEQDEQ